MDRKPLSVLETMAHIIIGIAMHMVIIVASRFVNLGIEPFSHMLIAGVSIALSYRFIRFYGRSMLGLTMADMRIGKPSVNLAQIGLALALPLSVIAFYLLFVPGDLAVVDRTAAERVLLLLRALFTTCLVSGICEEMFFRGILLRIAQDCFGKLPAAGLISVLFACGHFIGRGPMPMTDRLLMVICISSIGLAFAALTYRTGSVWPAALMHGTWNMITGGIVHIGTGYSADALSSYLIRSENLLITGGFYRLEGALPTMVACWAAMALILMWPKRKSTV